MAGALATGALVSQAQAHGSTRASSGGGRGCWPNGARLAISVSVMFEGGGQPISGAGGLIPEPIAKGGRTCRPTPISPTATTKAFRALDLFDKHGIKVSSFMIGEAIMNAPELAREIVRRGHETDVAGIPQFVFGGLTLMIAAKHVNPVER